MWRALHEGLVEIAGEIGEAPVLGIGVSTALHGLIARIEASTLSA